MTTINAIYEKGIFRPTEPVKLAEGSRVQIIVGPADEQGEKPERAPEQEAHFDRVYSILSRRYDGGASDVAARHNEHQP